MFYKVFFDAIQYFVFSHVIAENFHSCDIFHISPATKRPLEIMVATKASQIVSRFQTVEPVPSYLFI